MARHRGDSNNYNSNNSYNSNNNDNNSQWGWRRAKVARCFTMVKYGTTVAVTVAAPTLAVPPRRRRYDQVDACTWFHPMVDRGVQINLLLRCVPRARHHVPTAPSPLTLALLRWAAW